MIGERLAGAVTLGTYRTGSVIARMLPEILASGLANSVGVGASLANPPRRAMIERHLRRVNPTWSRQRVRAAVHEAFESYARYWVESFRLPSLSAETVAARLDVPDYGHIVAARREGRGAILALPHLGGWEWAGRWLADVGNPVTVVVERIDPPELFDWFADLRAKLGMTVVALGPEAGRATLQALKRNEIVCLLSDRNIGPGGVEVEFFGERTKLPAGPATLALRTGAPILPVAVYFTDRAQRTLRTRPSAASRSSGAARFATTSPASPRRSPPSSSTSSAGRPSSGTCSSRTGRATPATAKSPASALDRCRRPIRL